MMRHVSAPQRRFTQVPNDIVRHPDLSSDAVRLLVWLLSLAETSDVSFSDVARRAGIKNGAFQRAKAQLKEAGYAHEWRRQGADGRWVTTQLVTSVPLSAEEARAVRDGEALPGVPGAGKPAVGEPGPRVVGGHPTDKTGSNTSLPPAPLIAPPEEPPPPPPPGPRPTPPACLPEPLLEHGALILASVSHGEPRLRLTGREVKELAPLAADWLLRGVKAAQLREELSVGLPERIHHAAALLRNRLLRKLPDAPPIAAPPRPEPPRPKAKSMRECQGDHTQPLLFRPLDDEPWCRDCRMERAHAQAEAARGAAVRGAAAVRAALRGT
ncbi:hypothetical protein [Streptomyces mobaraensis]|uniref:Helix-turn-helix domain-containing protein n=1 Tax=Streptomyces mobaraensis TaxID=35621 RepID=A0A5N5WFY0_STRMB|nr:hypothetical protein [Streptomyces mobaraensis]KAB7852808.1 hypothetical protein FRZ00_00970 [Streptomyces mobaraensis]